MAHQHDVIVNRLLANYLERLLETDPEWGDSGSDLAAVCGILQLSKQDVVALKASVKKRLRGLVKLSELLGPQLRHWRKEFEDAV